LKRHSLGTFQFHSVSPSKRAEQFNSSSKLLLDSIVPSELQDDDERTLLEEAVSTLLLDSFLTLKEEFAVATLLLDSLLSLGVTGEELLSSSQATS
jgi:hypothetical protein